MFQVLLHLQNAIKLVSSQDVKNLEVVSEASSSEMSIPAWNFAPWLGVGYATAPMQDQRFCLSTDGAFLTSYPGAPCLKGCLLGVDGDRAAVRGSFKFLLR